jgi:hypothetical protein
VGARVRERWEGPYHSSVAAQRRDTNCRADGRASAARLSGNSGKRYDADAMQEAAARADQPLDEVEAVH